MIQLYLKNFFGYFKPNIHKHNKHNKINLFKYITLTFTSTILEKTFKSYFFFNSSKKKIIIKEHQVQTQKCKLNSISIKTIEESLNTFFTKICKGI